MANGGGGKGRPAAVDVEGVIEGQKVSKRERNTSSVVSFQDGIQGVRKSRDT